MARKNNYKNKNHPVTNNMNNGSQVARLYGKLNIGIKDSIKDEDEDFDFLIIDGNGSKEDGNIFDGNS